MKKLIFFLALSFLAFNCAEDESFNAAEREYAGIRTTGVTTSLPEDGGGTFTVPIYYGGKTENGSAFTVSYAVTGATYGTDYTIVGGTAATGTVTVPVGATGTVAFVNLQLKPVANFITQANKLLTITLTEAAGGKQVGYPLVKSIVLTIADDDCDYVEANFAPKTAATREILYNDGSGDYPGSTSTKTCNSIARRYCSNFTVTGANTFQITNVWDSGWNVSATLNPANRTITVPQVSFSDFGYDWTLSGSGTISTCGKTILIRMHLSDATLEYNDLQWTQEYTFP